jgi:hypothetical protein
MLLPVIVLRGADDRLKIESDRRISGNCDLWELLDDNQFELQRLVFAHAKLAEIEMAIVPREGILLNMISDPDLNPHTLSNLRTVLRQHKHRTIVNHPKQVLQTHRDEVAKTAAGITGLVTPGTIRVANKPAIAKKSVAEAELRYPLLARATGAHGGKALVKIDEAAKIGEISALSSRQVYLTEFHDFRSHDGLYRKCRFFVFATGEVVPRHLIIGRDWNIHSRTRADVMIAQPSLLDEEREFLENYQAILGDRGMTALRTLRKHLGLHCLGVDASLLANGDLLLFEANACMNALPFPSAGEPFDYLLPTKARLTQALSNLLLALRSPTP